MATTPNRIKITVMPEVDEQAVEQAARSAANLFLATYAGAILDGIQRDHEDEEEGVVLHGDWSDYRRNCKHCEKRTTTNHEEKP